MKRVPVYMLSAYDSEDLKAKCTARGASGYIIKPLTPAKLQATVR